MHLTQTERAFHSSPARNGPRCSIPGNGEEKAIEGQKNAGILAVEDGGGRAYALQKAAIKTQDVFAWLRNQHQDGSIEGEDFAKGHRGRAEEIRLRS